MNPSEANVELWLPFLATRVHSLLIMRAGCEEIIHRIVPVLSEPHHVSLVMYEVPECYTLHLLYFKCSCLFICFGATNQ